MSELTTIARPYAKAAFEYAVEKGAVDNWHQMLFFASEVANNEQVATYLSGSASVNAQADIFIQLCGEQLDAHGQNLIKVLAENQRLVTLPAVFQLFAEFKAEYDKEIEVEVNSAVELATAQQEKLAAALEKRFARKVKLNCSVDSGLVGGLFIRAGDTVIDGSLRGQLDRLATQLQS